MPTLSLRFIVAKHLDTRANKLDPPHLEKIKARRLFIYEKESNQRKSFYWWSQWTGLSSSYLRLFMKIVLIQISRVILPLIRNTQTKFSLFSWNICYPYILRNKRQHTFDFNKEKSLKRSKKRDHPID